MTNTLVVVIINQSNPDVLLTLWRGGRKNDPSRVLIGSWELGANHSVSCSAPAFDSQLEQQAPRLNKKGSSSLVKGLKMMLYIYTFAKRINTQQADE